jgi:chemotaxis regulatin CheY-phosphate phosphatase CheZ
MNAPQPPSHEVSPSLRREVPEDPNRETPPIGLLDRVEALLNLAAKISTESPKSRAPLRDSLWQELGAVRSMIDETFTCLQRMVSTIQERRSHWDIHSEGLLQRMEKQLSKVTVTTETATQQILDAVEKVISVQTDTSQKMAALITGLEKGGDPISSGLLLDSLRHLAEELEVAEHNSLQIIDYLQFQDIAAQQIEQAYGLLNEAEEKLVCVARTFRPTFVATTPGNGEHKSSFDGNAEYAPTEDKQKQIDALFQK